MPGFARFLQCLEGAIRVDAVVLFGSRATDDALDASDWDLAVVSEDFVGLDPVERGLTVVDCRAPGLELVHLTPGELMEPDFSYLRCAILEEGRALADRGAFDRAREQYEERKAAGEIVVTDGGVEFPRS